MVIQVLSPILQVSPILRAPIENVYYNWFIKTLALLLLSRGRGTGWAGWAFAHPVFREQKRNSLTSNLQSIKMKISRVVPILDTVGHITNYTWIGPAVIANLIKILFASYSWYSWSCDHLHLR